MADKILLINIFNGGISSGSKRGLSGSFRFGQGLDIHSDPDVLGVMPKSTKDSGSTVDGLILFGVTNTVNSNIYFLDENGALYKRTSAGVWSKLSTYTNSEGMGFFSGTNLIYFVSNDRQYKLDPSDDSITTGRILNSSTWHPVESFLDKVFTGNGRELVSTDGSGIDTDSTTQGGGITIDFNYSIRCLKNIGNWFFIGATSDNSSDARYFLWDGVSSDYNYSRTLKGEAGINAVNLLDDGTILINAGKQGNLYQLTGIDSPLVKIKQLPRIETSKTIETYPGSVTNYQGNALFGLSNGTSVTAERGVYSYTSTDKNYPKVANLDYAISTGTTTGITLQVGALLSANTTDLFVAWRDDTTYGVDKINGTGVQGTTIMESLIHDDGQPFRIKEYKNFKLKLAGDLATGEKVTFYYKADRGSWTSLGTLDYSVDGAIDVKNFKPDVRAYELELKTVTTNSSGTAPLIDDIVVVFSVEQLI